MDSRVAFAIVNRAPAHGYDFPAKAEYRTNVWKFFKPLARRANPKIVFMPDRDCALEVPLALSLGFREENLIAVNESAGTVAKWRKVYPNLAMTCGDEIGYALAAGKVAQSKIKIDAINLDLCGNFSLESLRTLIDVAHSDNLKSRVLVAITLLNGRETQSGVENVGKHAGGAQGVIDAYSYVANATWNQGGVFSDRMAAAFSPFVGAGFTVTPKRCETYRSGFSSMVYGMAVCEKKAA